MRTFKQCSGINGPSRVSLCHMETAKRLQILPKFVKYPDSFLFPFFFPFVLHLVPIAFTHHSLLTLVKTWVSSCVSDLWESSPVEPSSGNMSFIKKK